MNVELFTYWLVRYVPDVARGERVNVGLIAGRDGGDWAIRVAPDLRRASRIGGDASSIRPWLMALKQTFDDFVHPPLGLFGESDAPHLSVAWFELVGHRFNNVIQLGEATPVRAASASAAVDFLYPILVEAPAPVARSRTRTRLVNNLSDLYANSANLRVGKNLLRRATAQVGLQRGKFDFAVVRNSVTQLSQAFAFDLRDTELLEKDLQSWNFVVSRLRNDGGQVRLASQSRTGQIDKDVPISVAFQAPVDGRDSSRAFDVFDAAMEAWRTLGVRAVPSDQMDQIAREALVVGRA